MYKRWSGLLVWALVLATPVAAQTCPEDICECLGAAGDFSTVATAQAKVKSGKISVSGYGYAIPVFIEGSTCQPLGKYTGLAEGELDLGEDVVAAAPTGTALKFKGYKYYGYSYPGVFVAGDIATGGGTIKGQNYVELGGVIDTTGNHIQIADCANAITDVKNASATLAALPPTQTLGDVFIGNGDTYTINVGTAETEVIEINKLVIKPRKYYGYAYPSYLEINLDITTGTAVINVNEKLAIGQACEIIVNGDIEDVIINVPGPGSSVRIGKQAIVPTAILAPDRKLNAGADAFCANLYAAKLNIKGASVSDTLFCP